MPQTSILAITMGDPGGIGPEVILKSLKISPLPKSCRVVVVGSPSVFKLTSQKCHIKLPPIRLIKTFSEAKLSNHAVHFLDITNNAALLYKKISKKMPATGRFVDPGKVSLLNGVLAFTSLKIAARAASRGEIQAVVTAPVHKEAMRLVDSDFVGHTEYLAKMSHRKEYAMLFYSRYFCVTLATIHLALRRVAGKITYKNVLSKIRLTHDFLRKSLKIKLPKIAVACLNPHGSEFGEEESRCIAPAIRYAQKQGIRASGPLPGDQVFHEAYHKKYDAVVSMYHDQGLAPFKVIAFDSGVNVTLGLPYIRTSPDHGTAFDIAYQNKACHKSFLQSLHLAGQLI